LRFVTEELGFESDQHCFNFLVYDILNGDTTLVEDRSNKTDSHTDIYILLGKAGNVFEQAKRAAFGRVDIKGQI
jgi:hypothetical protein